MKTVPCLTGRTDEKSGAYIPPPCISIDPCMAPFSGISGRLTAHVERIENAKAIERYKNRFKREVPSGNEG